MSLRSYLIRRLLLIVLILLILGALTYVVSISFGSEDARYIVIASAAVGAAVIAAISFFVTSFEIQARMRPFVTVAKIGEIASPGPSGPNSAPYVLNGCTIHIQNTGSVPADNLNVCVSLVDRESGEAAKELRTQLPFLPPIVENTVNSGNLPDEIQPKLYTGGMRIEVFIKYDGLGKAHETKQTFDIETSKLPLVAPNFSIFVFKQVDPSYWS